MPEIIFTHPYVERGPDTNQLAGKQHIGWQIRAWTIQEVHKLGVTGKNIKGGVGDTGVSEFHIKNELSGVVDAKSFVGGSAFDRNGHGSHCLGIRFAKGDNDYGLIGVAPDGQAVSAKCLSDSGSGSDAGIAKSIEWMVYQGCHTISLSLGSPQQSQRITDAIRDAHNAGVIVFAAAGNDGRNNNVDYPAAGGYCIAVPACDWNLSPARFSDGGPSVQSRGVMGAGVNVWSTTARSFARYSGTSMATPHVAGLCDLAIDAEIKFVGSQQTKSFEDFLTLVRKYQVDLGANGDDPRCGLGTFDILSYVRELKAEFGDDDDDDDDPIIDPPVEPSEPETICQWKDRGYQYSILKEKLK